MDKVFRLDSGISNRRSQMLNALKKASVQWRICVRIIAKSMARGSKTSVFSGTRYVLFLRSILDTYYSCPRPVYVHTNFGGLL
jgi:hypothetical protein